MEKKSSKKKLLFILIPVLAVLAAGGLIVGLNAKNWFGPKETPPAETESAPADTEVEPSTEPEDVVVLPVAYNLDFEYYSGMTEGGLSSRPKGEDGLFHIVVSIEGVQKELLTDKYSMVNVIDSREFSCIDYDEDNRITAVGPGMAVLVATNASGEEKKLKVSEDCTCSSERSRSLTLSHSDNMHSRLSQSTGKSCEISITGYDTESIHAMGI